MPRPIRLRTRVFSFALIYASIFIGMMIVLAVRIRQSERELRVIVEHETRTIAKLQELLHSQQDFMQRVAADRSSAPALASNYEQLMRLADGVASETTIDERLHEFENGLRAGAPASVLAENSTAIVMQVRSELRSRRQALEERVERLERNTRNTLRAAFGTLYILLIASIAIIKAMIDRIVLPIEAIINVSQRLIEKKYDARIPEQLGSDYEIRELTLNFNRMAANLQAATAQLQETATTDELTGLPNFRKFREKIEEEIRRDDRYQRTFGLLVFDLDRFKRYNDNYGHLAGNEALQLVATAIRGAMREVDFAARYGGEEFAAVLPETDEAALLATAERIRRSIANIPAIEGRTTLTVSVGGATFPFDGTTAEQLFTVADERLYEAKKKGRNRSIVSTQVSSKTTKNLTGTSRTTEEM